MKDTYYFSHDYNARTDPKIKRLLSKHSLAGYGLFWAIVEDLYNNANALPLDCDAIAYDLRADSKLVESVINDFDLFVIDTQANKFGSLSVERRLEKRDEKSKKAKENADIRWRKYRESQSLDANALQTHSDGNAIKESKGKESKENEIISNGDSDNVLEKTKYSSIPKTIDGITAFIISEKPKHYQPYLDIWNLFAEKYGTAKVVVMSNGRKNKLRVRLNDERFDFIEILKNASKQSYALSSKWFTFDWLIENDTNYAKILEKKYTEQGSSPKEDTSTLKKLQN